MKIYTTIIFTILLSTSIFGQNTLAKPNPAGIPEVEPNNVCGDSGVITITSGGFYEGSESLLGTFYDYWKIEAGSSGNLEFNFVSDDGDALFLLESRTGSPCGSLVTQTPIPQGITQQITLNASNYYTIRISAGISLGPANYTITVTDLGALPVELTSFTANILKNKVALSWETATEVNNYGFEILRAVSIDSNSEGAIPEESWEKVGFVNGHGNSNSPKSYNFTDNSNTASRNYFYRLKQIDIDGQYEYSDIVEVSLNLSHDFSLAQNYPNPFNPTTKISYTMPQDGYVNLVVFDILGSEVETLVHNFVPQGVHEVTFNAKDLASGFYIYKINVSTENNSGSIFTATNKMFLIK